MEAKFTNTRESLDTAKQPDINWATLSTAERIKHLELEGYVVLPDLLSSQQVEAINSELSRVATARVDYTPYQRGCRDVVATDSPTAIGVIALPAMVEFLKTLFGDELICTSCAYSLSQPGHPGIAIHTDSQPYGSKIFGVQASSPCLGRVLYYLDDLTPQRSPFKVIPRSHLSMHADAIPYKRYLRHDQELMVTCKAGSAAIINQKVFHGNFPNYSNEDRRMLAIAYRPAWAGPIGDVPDRDPEPVAKLPAPVRELLGSLNTRNVDFDVPNRPDDLATSAAGLNPGRWEG